MRKMKKRFFAAVILCCAFLLCACAGKDPENYRGTKYKVENGAMLNSYTSAVLGVGCEFNDEYRFLTDSEIAQVNGSKKVVPEIIHTMEEGAGFFDLTVQRKAGGSSLIVFVEKLAAEMKSLSIEEIADKVIEEELSLLADQGINKDDLKRTTVFCAGEDRPAIMVTTKSDDLELKQTLVFLKGNFDCYGMITVTALDADETENMLKAFHILNDSE